MVQIREIRMIRRFVSRYEYTNHSNDTNKLHMKKIKLLIILNTLDAGGAENIVLQLCRNLDKNKYQIAVATVMGGGALQKEFSELGAETFIFQKKGKFGLNVIKSLRALMRQYKPDIVHTHLWSGDTWGRIAALLENRFILVSTEHNRNEDEGVLKKWVKHFLSYFTTQLVASSVAIKDYQVRKELIDAKRIVVIYYGIELDRFPFRGVRTARYGDGPLKLLTIGRLTQQKGQWILLEAMTKFDDIYPDAELTILGEGEMREELERVAKRLRIDGRVKFAGKVSNPQEYLKDADLFILPSIYEGLGVVLLEAMSVGVPVIASDIPAVDEVIENENNGLLFPAENSAELVDDILRIIKNVDLQTQLVENARKTVEEKFTVQRMAHEYDALYSKLLAEAEKRKPYL